MSTMAVIGLCVIGWLLVTGFMWCMCIMAGKTDGELDRMEGK